MSQEKPKLKGKGKVVTELARKRKWLDEMSATDRATLTHAEEVLLARQESQYIKNIKRLKSVLAKELLILPEAHLQQV